ncbi:cupredoxin domain-containing protein [Rhodopseudomonas palustris]|uniref:EfeO-type cupredoxin-like domain-containing protein n=1 Tax=Rhodopseudomonas palustris (strain BisB18) TaxID=316056 RepID=Q210Z2_RHOPB
MKKYCWMATALLLVLTPPVQSRADEVTVEIEMNNGVITPQRLEVPANTRFRLIIKNTGTMPAEFESKELHKEEVVAAGATGRMIFRKLEPGEYSFVDDFSPDAPPAVLIAK